MTWRWFDLIPSVDASKVGGFVEFAEQHMWCVWVQNSDDVRRAHCTWRLEGMRALDAADIILVLRRLFPTIEQRYPWMERVGREAAYA